MKVWLLQSGEPVPRDAGDRPLRSGMLAAALAERGNEVLWWTSAFEHQRKRFVAQPHEEWTWRRGVRVHALPAPGYRRNVSIARYRDHRAVATAFTQRARQEPLPDLVIASMPCHHLAYAAAMYASERGIPLVADVRDLWPDIFAARLPAGPLRALGRLVLTGDQARLRFLLRRADAIVAVSHGYLRWALAKAGRSQRALDGVFYIGQYPPRRDDVPALAPAIASWIATSGAQRIFTFVGTLGGSYRVDVVLRAAERLAAAGRRDIGFVIAGEGEQREAVQAAAARLPNVCFTGWLERPAVAALLAASSVGLVPCESADDTLPNKVFEYLAFGLPLISSLEGEMTELITNRGLGANYRFDDVHALERAVLRLADDETARSAAAQAAEHCFHELGDAGRIYEAFAELAERAQSARAPHEQEPERNAGSNS